MVEQQNMGVANIPSYLGVTGNECYFLNDVGLHNETIRKIIADEGIYIDNNNSVKLEMFKKKLAAEINNIANSKRNEYKHLKKAIEEFYKKDILYSAEVKERLKEFIS